MFSKDEYTLKIALISLLLTLNRYFLLVYSLNAAYFKRKLFVARQYPIKVAGIAGVSEL